MDGMNTDWLQQLAPAHAPPPAGWWPLAPGWWLLLLICVSLVAGLSYWYWRPSQRLRRIALRELDHLQTHAHDDGQLAGALQNLLRRYAIAAYGRETVGELSGDDWLAFLVAHGGKDLAGETGRELLRAAYGSRMLYDHTPWLQGARDFLRGRR